MSGRPDDARERRSTDLIDRLLRTDEPAYRAAVQAGARTGRRRVVLRVLTFLSCIVIGLIAAVGAHALRVAPSASDEHRHRLEQAVRQREARVAAQERTSARLHTDVEQLRQRGTAGADAEIDRAIASAAKEAGHEDVTGPGLEIQLDDREVAGPVDPGAREAPSGSSRVRAQDLQTIVNALWAAGAEAVSINGHRLTSLSTIRFASAAIIVDFSPLAPPYTVHAIGDSQRLAALDSSGTVERLHQDLRGYGITVTVTTKNQLTVPAGGNSELRSARPFPGTAVTAPGSTEGERP